jgi:transporter family-2 protein
MVLNRMSVLPESGNSFRSIGATDAGALGILKRAARRCTGITGKQESGDTMYATIIAALSGVAMAFQGAVNAAASSAISLSVATFIVMAAGTVVSAVYMTLSGTTGNLALRNLAKAPWWAYTGGLVGPAITAAVAHAIERAGAVNATTGIILGQLGFAAVIDHLGWFGAEPIRFSPIKIAGIILIAVGGRILLAK